MECVLHPLCWGSFRGVLKEQKHFVPLPSGKSPLFQWFSLDLHQLYCRCGIENHKHKGEEQDQILAHTKGSLLIYNHFLLIPIRPSSSPSPNPFTFHILCWLTCVSTFTWLFQWASDHAIICGGISIMSFSDSTCHCMTIYNDRPTDHML